MSLGPVKSSETPRIFRVLLQVKELDRSRRFYESLLATRGRHVGGGRIYFDCGPMILALLDPSADGESTVSTLPEPLYFAVTDLEGVYRRARKLGCLSSSLVHSDPANPAGVIVVRPWGERSFYTADPSGNPLCFVDARTLFTGAARQSAIWRRTYGERRRARPPASVNRPKPRPRSRKRAG